MTLMTFYISQEKDGKRKKGKKIRHICCGYICFIKFKDFSIFHTQNIRTICKVNLTPTSHFAAIRMCNSRLDEDKRDPTNLRYSIRSRREVLLDLLTCWEYSKFRIQAGADAP